MSILHGTEVSNPTARLTRRTQARTRESAALILMALAIVLTVSFIGMTIG